MARSRFDSFSAFVAKRRRLILIAWVVALVLSSTQIPTFFGAVNYNIANGGSSGGGPTNTQSQLAQNILDKEFPANASSGNNNIVLVIQGDQTYSSAQSSAILALNRSLASDPALARNYTGMDSVYQTEVSILSSTVTTLIPQVSQLAAGTNQSWRVASAIVSNATGSSLASAPLFHVNATALAGFISGLSSNSDGLQVREAAASLVANSAVKDYPLVITRGLSQNFVSADNRTTITVFNFGSTPDLSQVAAFRKDVQASGIAGLGSYWVTGGTVLQQDLSQVFGPAVGVTVVPGVIASIIIVGLLLLSPLAAFVPVVVGGFAIGISLPLIYFGVVKIGGGTLGFLTPTLTILLVLGLSVDYSVLQLRRTREERQKGRSKEESVAVSMRWAGQAVLTAGVTVVVAYLVMWITNVPLFSDVGLSIAISVSVLIAGALTLLPALELTLGDKIFWPSLKRGMTTRPSKLERLTEKTLRRKYLVIAVVGALAIGAVFVSQQTSAGENFLKLIPNFPSNEGLTVMDAAFGSTATGPTEIVATLPTPIVYGADQLNQTLLNDVESLTSAVTGVNGVVSVASPTSPYGAPFNYSAIQQMPQPERAQYLQGLLSYIGLDNRTVLINVGLKNDPQSQAAIGTMLMVESSVHSVAVPQGTVVYFGGTTSVTQDDQSFIDGIVPQVIITLAIAIYIILFIQLRSAFTPIRLIFTILCSVAFSLAVLVTIFYYALSLPILDLAPLFVVVTMLGVGIDYDIFLVTRIREEVLSGKSDDEAIKTAISKSWVTIVGLGLVLSTVFGSVVLTGIAILQQIGLVVAVAVMIDVTTVILFFVPALMGLVQRYNWWPSKTEERRK
ncbi:MAG: MMPL family transporter [Thaumarchaeota archaeon]|nr:MMPL family transporter [Nitrososphaerota archaeon]